MKLKTNSSRGSIAITIAVIGLGLLFLGILIGSIAVRTTSFRTGSSAQGAPSPTPNPNCTGEEGGVSNSGVDFRKPGSVTVGGQVYNDICPISSDPAINDFYCDDQGKQQVVTKSCKDIGAETCTTTDGIKGFCTGGPTPVAPAPFDQPIPTPGGTIPAGIYAVAADIQSPFTTGNVKVTFCRGNLQNGAFSVKLTVDGDIVVSSVTQQLLWSNSDPICKQTTLQVQLQPSWKTNACYQTIITANALDQTTTTANAAWTLPVTIATPSSCSTNPSPTGGNPTPTITSTPTEIPTPTLSPEEKAAIIHATDFDGSGKVTVSDYLNFIPHYGTDGIENGTSCDVPPNSRYDPHFDVIKRDRNTGVTTIGQKDCHINSLDHSVLITALELP